MRDMKQWMKILIIGFTLLGVVAVFGGIYITLIKSQQYILADPARLEGARAFALLVGSILMAFALGLGCLKTLGYYARDYRLRAPRFRKHRVA